MRRWTITLFFSLSIFVTACDVLPQVPTVTPTRRFTASTLEPSPEVLIQNSDELYGDDVRDGQSNPTAAALPVDAPLPPLQSGSISETGAQPIQIFLNDQIILTGDIYVRGSTDDRVAGILILAEDIPAWGSLPAELFDAGYTVLVVQIPIPFLAENLDTLLRSLSENGSVDPARLAVIGAQSSADTALLGCAIFEICDAVVLLSPQNRDALLNVLPNYNPRPMFLVASTADATSFATASSLATSFAEGSQYIEQPTGTGTGLLTLNSNLSGALVNWFTTVWD
ncbi:MAG: hypothetical protein AAFV93_20600 [Chloroflexota bacterium]